MHILLVAATKLEIQPSIDLLEGSGSLFYGHKTEVLVTGIGGIATTWSLTERLRDRRPDLVLQAGIAGCLTGRKTGDTVAVKEEILADLGVWEQEQFKSLFDMGLTERNAPPFTDGLLVNPFASLRSRSGLETVRSISVNEITTLPNRIAWYQQNWSPVVESMEGGAFHYACLREAIPFLQVRAISNQVGERDKTKWDFRSAITNLNEQIGAFVGRL